MRNNGNIYIHLIVENDDVVLNRERVSCIPRVGDEVRLGGKGNESFYRVTRVIWIYDEPDNPFERANIGLELLDK